MLLTSTSVEDTKRFAQAFAQHIKPGDVIILQGDLAAGKTKFVECCCEALGYKAAVNSPTYTMANVYPLDDCDIVHADFYRMKSEGEIFEIGLDFYLGEAIIFIEWGECFADFFNDYLLLKIDAEEESDNRTLKLSAHGDLWEQRFGPLKETLETLSL